MARVNRRNTASYEFGSGTYRSTYSSAYGYGYGYGATAPDTGREEGGRVKRTRERPKREPQKTQKTAAAQSMPRKVMEAPQNRDLSMRELTQIVFAVLFVTALMITVLILNAHASALQCSINSLTKSNLLLEDEIKVLTMEIDGDSSIQQVESYAIDKMGMQYPTNSQSAYISENETVPEDFAKTLREKAYS